MEKEQEVVINLYKQNRFITKLENLEFRIHLEDVSHTWFKNNTYLDGNPVYLLKLDKDLDNLDEENTIELVFGKTRYIFTKCRFKKGEDFTYCTSEDLVGPLLILDGKIENGLGEFSELAILKDEIYLGEGWITNTLPEKPLEISLESQYFKATKIKNIEISKIENQRIYFNKLILKSSSC